MKMRLEASVGFYFPKGLESESFSQVAGIMEGERLRLPPPPVGEEK